MRTSSWIRPPPVSERHTDGGGGNGGVWYSAGGACTLPAGKGALGATPAFCAAVLALAAAFVFTIAVKRERRAIELGHKPSSYPSK